MKKQIKTIRTRKASIAENTTRAAAIARAEETAEPDLFDVKYFMFKASGLLRLYEETLTADLARLRGTSAEADYFCRQYTDVVNCALMAATDSIAEALNLLKNV